MSPTGTTFQDPPAAQPPVRMSEIELIRAQLATERTHALQVACACLTAIEQAAASLDGVTLTAFCATCVEYLSWVLTRFQAREHRLLPLEDGDPESATAPAVHALTADSCSLDPVSPARPDRAWRAFAQSFSPEWHAWQTRREERFGLRASLKDWHAMAGIDAHTILDERMRFARVQAAAPPGIELRPGARWLLRTAP